MRARPAVLILAGLSGIGAGVVPALAASERAGQTVTGKNIAWSPATVSIAVGDTVTWQHADGSAKHNVKFDDGSFEQPAESEPTTGPGWAAGVSRTFSAAGDFGYICEVHPNMTGRVVVAAAGTTGTQTTPPTTTQTTTSTTTQTGPSSVYEVVTDPAGSGFRVRAAKTFCARPSRRCRRPGILLRFSGVRPSRAGPARIAVTLRRATKVLGTRRYGIAAGDRLIRLRRDPLGRRLRPGRYSALVRSTDGLGGSRVTLRFRVR